MEKNIIYLLIFVFLCTTSLTVSYTDYENAWNILVRVDRGILIPCSFMNLMMFLGSWQNLWVCLQYIKRTSIPVYSLKEEVYRSSLREQLSMLASWEHTHSVHPPPHRIYYKTCFSLTLVLNQKTSVSKWLNNSVKQFFSLCPLGQMYRDGSKCSTKLYKEMQSWLSNAKL